MPEWWQDWLRSETPMIAEQEWYGGFADIYNQASAVLMIGDAMEAFPHIAEML